jgi:hypothetical protein
VPTVALDVVSGAVAVGDVGVGGCDVATAGSWGMSWGATVGQQGCVWGLLDCRCSRLGGFVKYTTRSEERVRTTSRNGVSRAVDGVGVAFTAGGWVSVVGGAVCMLDGALDAVSEAVVAGNVGSGGCDVVTAMGRSGRGGRGWGLGWGAVGRLGSVCRCF